MKFGQRDDSPLNRPLVANSHVQMTPDNPRSRPEFEGHLTAMILKKDPSTGHFMHTDEEVAAQVGLVQWHLNPSPPPPEPQGKLRSALYAAASRRGALKTLRALLAPRGNTHFWPEATIRHAMSVADRMKNPPAIELLYAKIHRGETRDMKASERERSLLRDKVHPNIDELIEDIEGKRIRMLRDDLDEYEYDDDILQAAARYARSIGWAEGENLINSRIGR